MVSVTGEHANDSSGSQTPNSLDIQANTNYFAGSNGHRNWVQFVAMSSGATEDISICIWQADFGFLDAAASAGDWTKTYCIGGGTNGGGSSSGIPIKKRPGVFKPMDFAAIAGSTYKDSSGQDVLGMVVQLSWWDPNNSVQDPNYPTINRDGLYSLVEPDYYGLAGRWSNISGGLVGINGCAHAEFDPGALVNTKLLAGTCLNSPSPVSGIPWPGDCPGTAPFLSSTTLGQDSLTCERNNLVGVMPTGPTSSDMDPETVAMEYWESTDGNCPTALDPHVYVRDSDEDTGATPSNIGGQRFWESPDIFLVEHGTPIVPWANSMETLVTPNRDYDIWVRVNNDFGCDDVQQVQALVYLADPSALGTQWKSASGGDYSGGTGQEAGVTAKAHQQALLGPFTWHAPATDFGDGHKCIIAAIRATNEAALDPNSVWDAPNSYQVAQRNIQFSSCAYPLTNTSGSSGSLILFLSVRPPDVLDAPNPGDPASDVEFSIDDWDKAWYPTWVNQLNKNPGAFAISHDDSSGQTVITLVTSKPSVTLDSVTLDANTSPTLRVTKLDVYENGQPAIATAAVHTTLNVGGVTIENGGSCRTPLSGE